MAKNRFSQITVAVMAALLALCLTFSAFSEEAVGAAHRQVRVGLFPLGMFQYFDESGAAKGYNADYLKKIASLTHWELQYVPADSWSDALAMLDRGEIDLLAPAQITPDRIERYEYSATYMGTECGALYTMADAHEALSFEDFEAINTLRCGAAEGSPFTEQFQAYCEKNGMNPQITLYPDMTQLLAAMQNGEVDAAVTNILFSSADYRLLCRFEYSPVYYISDKNHSALIDELDSAMLRIGLDDPSYQSSLLNQYFPIFSVSELTHEEQEFVEAAPEIIIGYEKGALPLSYVDEQGEFRGITRDILDKIAEISGLRFRYVQLPNDHTVTYEYLMENNISVTCNVEYNTVNASMRLMQMSMPYLSTEKVFVMADTTTFDEQSALTLATSTGSTTLASVLGQEYPNFTLQNYSTVEEAFAAVYAGKADLLIKNRYVAERLLNKPAYYNMKVIPVQGLPDNLCLCVMNFNDPANTTNAELYNSPFISIVDKAIQRISKADLNSIIIRNTAECTYKMSLADMLYQYRTQLLLFAGILMVIVISLLHYNRLRRKSMEALAENNQKLAQAVEQANNATQVKSRFLAQMSHEIRTPMNAIIGMTQLAKNVEDNPSKTQEYLQRVGIASKMLLNIINDILDMSAIEGGKMKIANEPFDLQNLLSGISTVYYPQCAEKGVRFNLYTKDLTDETFSGDALRINQILMNLVSNAYKFTDRGGQITLTVSQHAGQDQQTFLRFVVEDTGCGMSEEYQKHLFHAFEQESATTAQKHGGSGLGLAITKNLIVLMHGAVTVRSKVNEGTTFTVDLPVQRVNLANCRTDPSSLGKMRALVVDDDPKTVEYNCDVLKRLGVKYDTALSGEEALEKVKALNEKGEHYDLCLIDWRMGGISGVETIRGIRQLVKKQTMLILVSAYDLSEVSDEAKAAGADVFISKPLFQSTLFNTLLTIRSEKQEEPTEKQPGTHQKYDFSGKRVLLAEDFDLNREVAMDILELVNVEVDCAVDGQEALDKFLSSEPDYYDMILMDIQMPKLDGYEATRRIRASSHPQAAAVPIFAMTANAFTEDVSAALSAGMNGHIAKPIDTAALYKLLSQQFTNGKPTNAKEEQK